MSDGTMIEWTEATWNPITGCGVCSPGCTNCYAMKLAGTRLQHHPSRAGLTINSKAGPVWTGEVRFNKQWLDQPLRWRRPRMIFVCAHGDLFHESVPDEWIDRVFAVMALAPQHTFQVLTKRSARMRKYMTAGLLKSRIAAGVGRISPAFDFRGWHWPLPNVWLGVSVEDQARAAERVPDLLATPAAVRWLSCEPLLGPVDLTNIALSMADYIGPPVPRHRVNSLTGQRWQLDTINFRRMPFGEPETRIDWIVAGGESGAGARPMHPDWARSLRDQCAAAVVPFFFKQWGEWAASGEHNLETLIGGDNGAHHPRFETRWISNEPKAGRTLVAAVGKKRAGRHLDGQLHDGLPA